MKAGVHAIHWTTLAPFVGAGLLLGAERLPAGVYREIDAGHLAPFEEPAIFTALVREFLDGLDHIPVI